MHETRGTMRQAWRWRGVWTFLWRQLAPGSNLQERWIRKVQEGNMRKRLGSAALVALMLCVAVTVFADSAKDSEEKANQVRAIATTEESSDAASATPEASPAAPPQGANEPAASPANPIAATTGTLGLFTLETGETLPRGGWSAAAYVNKFTRMPGSTTFLNVGVNF